ncbi:MAG TPA: hypothetical protein VFN87_07690 [Solirubrobacteraceae bacterium]|nr:hypothetical protein [Solirubrobacteraceae bacterium]
MKRFTRRAVTARVASVGLVVALASGVASASHAAAPSSLPTVNVALTGTTGVSVSGSMVSGAVNLTSTFAGKAPTGPNANGPTVGLVRLNPGATLPEAVNAVQSHKGDLNALTPYASLVLDATAPGTVQTTLTPGSYVALNITGNTPAFAPFTVTQAPSPAALPPASATLTAIEFAFRGPHILRNGSLVRSMNGGWLVHMNELIGMKSRTDAVRAMKYLRAGKDQKAVKLATGSLINLMGPASPGAMQQEVLNAKPGYYVEACFMTTLDGREHTQLGMERLVKVVR